MAHAEIAALKTKLEGVSGAVAANDALERKRPRDWSCGDRDVKPKIKG